ncbi:DoxX-like family protein [Polaromonas sp.]|uniref:DoxX-like family protein n=1 Tax=Polaromonas sp. TaxID=1869339 RepID=UPI003CA68D51
MTLSGKDQQLLRQSIVFVWLATAIVSVWELQGQSAQLLLAAGVQDASLARWLILAGAGVDAALGLAMLLWPARLTYLAALTVMALMTLVATGLDPSLWLHPLGPLTKNLPIAAVLLVLAKAKP